MINIFKRLDTLERKQDWDDVRIKQILETLSKQSVDLSGNRAQINNVSDRLVEVSKAEVRLTQTVRRIEEKLDLLADKLGYMFDDINPPKSLRLISKVNGAPV